MSSAAPPVSRMRRDGSAASGASQRSPRISRTRRPSDESAAGPAWVRSGVATTARTVCVTGPPDAAPTPWTSAAWIAAAMSNVVVRYRVMSSSGIA